MAEYPMLAFLRVVLEHEKARNRLWGRFKHIRKEEDLNYTKSQSILSEKEVAQQQHSLDYQY